MSRRLLALSLLCACQDPKSKGEPGDPPVEEDDTAADSPAPAEDSSTETGLDSADTGDTSPPPGLELSVGSPEPDPSGAATTCSDVGPVSWDLTVEWTYDLQSFVMNALVAPQAGAGHASIFLDQSGIVTTLDGQTGATLQEIDLAPAQEDGSTAVVGDADGVPGLELVTPAGDELNVVDTLAGTWTTFGMSSPVDELVLLVDADLDGAHEIATPTATYTLDGALVAAGPLAGSESTGSFAADLDQDGLAEVVGFGGIWGASGEGEWLWDLAVGAGYNFYGGPVLHEGQARVWFTNDSGALYLAEPNGALVSSATTLGENFLSAIGDASGDGAPDICGREGEDLVLADLDGNELQRWNNGYAAFYGGGCSMADLDADGVYELVIASYRGFFIYDGRTGAALASDPSLITSARDSGPVVADIDGDGGAEILVLTSDRLVALGPAEGRWARTRPVWNALAYDVTSIRDDGTLVSWPAPSWEAYNAFRAQPAHDGVKPDLEIEVAAALETVEGADWGVLSFTVRNRGSAESPAGAALILQVFDGSAVTEQELGTIEEPIPAGYAVEGTYKAPLADLGARWALTVAGADDCDRVNDRADGLPP